MIFFPLLSILFIYVAAPINTGHIDDLISRLERADRLLANDDAASIEKASVIYRAILKEKRYNYDALAGLARSLYLSSGLASRKKGKKEILLQCIDYAKQAISADKSRADAHYWCGLCYGRYAEMSGIFAGASLVSKIKAEMESVLSIDPSYSHGGAYRVLGRIYYSLPWIMGGNKKKSLDYLKTAIKYDPYYPLNHLYLADTYIALGEEKLAKEELNRVLSIDSVQKGIDDDASKIKMLAKEKLKRWAGN